MQTSSDTGPWYRQRWPWLLMLPPAAAIVAGAVTIWIAVVTSDGLVEDDYYKQGLGVNQRIARDEAAKRLGVGADLMLSADGRSLRALIAAREALPAEIRVKLTHPTRKGYDQAALLQRQEDGLYAAAFDQPINGRRIVTLESPGGEWRLVGEWDSSRQDAIALGAAVR
jgi:hypothetical protein